MNARSRAPRVMLAFHAHEPLVENKHLSSSPLDRLTHLLETLGAPVSLAVSNELVHQLQRDLPDAFARLREGFVARTLRPLYLPAHHAPAALLSPAELTDELRLNEECLHGLLAAPRPSRRGLAIDGGLDARLVPSLEEGGFDFVLQTAADDAARNGRRASYDYAHRPFRVGERLVALPLATCPLSLDRDDNVAALRATLDAAPERASLVFLYELEELEPALSAWSALRESGAAFELTAPEELFEADALTPPWLPELRFASEPEIELIEEPDDDDPFAMWQGGQPMTRVLQWLVDAFGFSRIPPVRAETLFDDDYQLDGLPARAQVPLYLRLVKAACHAALDAEAGLPQRPYLDGYRLCDALDRECKLTDTQPSAVELPLEQLEQLGRLPELLVDPRVAYQRVELDRLRQEGGPAQALATELEGAQVARLRADEEFACAREAYAELRQHQLRGRARWRELVRRVRDHLGAVCVALDHLERATRVATGQPVLAEQRA